MHQGPAIRLFSGLSALGESLKGLVGGQSQTEILGKELRNLNGLPSLPNLDTLDEVLPILQFADGASLVYAGQSLRVDNGRGATRPVNDNDLHHLDKVGVTTKTIVESVRRILQRMKTIQEDLSF